jgi:predicted transcriptional regulator
MKIDLSKKGFFMIHPDWQLNVLDVLWESNSGLVSRDVWIRVNEKMKPESISRASVINFLNYMLGMGVLSGVEEIGKGGYHWRYSPVFNKSEYRQYIAETALKTLKKNYPAEFKKALETIS